VQAGALRRLIPSDPASADELVVELREEIRGAISDIRRLVYDLRPPAIATRVLAYFAGSPPGGTPPQAFPTLTDREREILKLIARGHPNPSIARELSLSTKTVGNYVSNIFTKLQVADRAQAIIRAREAGFG
jgi:DNA-binding NarL/FixJ family response regulator